MSGASRPGLSREAGDATVAVATVGGDREARGTERYRELLKAGAWFRGLSDELQDTLLAYANLQRLANGERVFSRGDPPSGLYAVLDGAIRITATTARGKEALLILEEPPSWFGEVSLFDGLPRTHDAVADQDTLLLHLRQEVLIALLEREPRYWRELGVLMTRKLRLAFIVMEEAAVLPLPARLARLLWLMAEGYGEWLERSLRQLEVRQDQLASMLSTSRQTVNQLLKELETAGVVRVAYGRIEILDMPALQRAAAQT